MVAFIRIDGVFTLKDHIYRDAEGYVYRTLGLRLWEKTTPMGVGLSSGRPARLISFQLTVCHPCPFQPVEGPAALPSGKPTIFKDHVRIGRPVEMNIMNQICSLAWRRTFPSFGSAEMIPVLGCLSGLAPLTGCNGRPLPRGLLHCVGKPIEVASLMQSKRTQTVTPPDPL